MLADRAADEGTTERRTVAEVLERAVAMHQGGQFDAAETLYGHILQAVPECADALHFLGILQHQTGRSDKAVALIDAAIRLQPSHPAMRNNLGNILLEQDRPREAARAYRAALKLDPANADAHNNFGVCAKKLGRRRTAEASYRRAIRRDPGHRDAHNNLGTLLVADGRFEEAIRLHAHALEVAPPSPDSRRFIVSAYVAAGDIDRALTIAEGWAAEEPGSATARHLLAAVSGRNVPARASDDFVEIAFDRFAATFDTKLAKLEYRAPELVAAAVAAAYGPPRGDLRVLDAGCGTGLCGPLLAPFASDLEGVDLSARMLDQARQRNCYTAIVKAELTGHMLERPGAFDLIASADTLCYFGDLHDVLSAAETALGPGGVLIFSVEAEPSSADYKLNPHGRYSHTAAYVAAALTGAGLAVDALDDAVLRMESMRPVAGLVVTARKAVRSQSGLGT